MTTAPVDRDDVLRKSDLNSTHNRYDYFLAAPSDQELTIMWIIWAIIAIIAALICAILIISILSYKKTRKNPFDIYVVYLTLPDMLYSTFCAITCFMNYQVGHYYSSPMCEWQSFYCVFDFTANSWMNAVIARQLHSLIQKTHNRQHLEPIQIRSVTFHASCVYLYATFVASWTLYGFLPHRAMVSSGMACVPVEYSRTSTLFFWVVFTPAFVGIPLFYTLYVCFDVYWRGTLPRSGRTRVLAFYFLRLSSIFTLMWVPTVITIFAIPTSAWVTFAGGTWSHLQGVASALFAITKPDIHKAVLRLFLTCRCPESEPNESAANLPTAASQKHRTTKSTSHMSNSWHIHEISNPKYPDAVSDANEPVAATQSQRVFSGSGGNPRIECIAERSNESSDWNGEEARQPPREELKLPTQNEANPDPPPHRFSITKVTLFETSSEETIKSIASFIRRKSFYIDADEGVDATVV